MLISAAGGVVCTVGVFVGPGVIRAASEGFGSSAVTERRSAPADPVLLDVFTRLERLCNESEGVLGVWERTQTGGSELMLWTHDGGLERTVECNEVMLLSYSPALRVLTAYVMRSGVGDGEVFPGPVDERTAAWWRGRGDVERRIVATGLESVRFERAGGDGRGGEVRVHLMWERRSSEDALLEASFGVRAPWVGEGR